MTIWTIGHSNRSVEEFTDLLQHRQIELLADIRSVPRSRHNPQYNRDTLPDTLAAQVIGYVHMPGLGGLRSPREDSTNTAWQNDSFRGYADYMQTPEFESSLDALVDTAQNRRVVIMCAEAVPWRCHRSLVADALIARGIEVRHILSETSDKAHTLTSFAHLDHQRVSYPGLPVPTVR